MLFDDHLELKGTHAFLSPSQSAWLRYSDEKLLESYTNFFAAQRGTRLHAWAQETIALKIRQPKSKKTLYMYVNDCIGFRMETEQLIYYSPYCYGTADAISFRDGLLRIFDLKTGTIPAHMEQLEIYAALFCLKKKTKPTELQIELRIYQLDEVVVHTPDPEKIRAIADKIVEFDRLLARMDAERIA